MVFDDSPKTPCVYSNAYLLDREWMTRSHPGRQYLIYDVNNKLSSPLFSSPNTILSEYHNLQKNIDLKLYDLNKAYYKSPTNIYPSPRDLPNLLSKYHSIRDEAFKPKRISVSWPVSQKRTSDDEVDFHSENLKQLSIKSNKSKDKDTHKSSTLEKNHESEFRVSQSTTRASSPVANAKTQTNYGEQLLTKEFSQLEKKSLLNINDLNVKSLAKFQLGSRYLQKLLLQENEKVTSVILNQVIDNIFNLMMDPYGNYLCQHLCKVCTSSQREMLVKALEPHALKIAQDRRGTHSMQAIISLSQSSIEEKLILKPLEPAIISLSLNLYGTYVVQRAIMYFSEETLHNVFQMIVDHLNLLATDPHGLCVVKKTISTLKNTKSQFQNLLLEQLIKYNLLLVQSPFGNYAIQHALVEWGSEKCASIVEQIKNNIPRLAIQKFSSNVVEKIIENATDNDVYDIVQMFADQNVMSELVKSSYGSYVVQKAIERATWAQILDIYSVLKFLLLNIPKKKLRSRWSSTIEAINNKIKNACFENSHQSNVPLII